MPNYHGTVDNFVLPALFVPLPACCVKSGAIMAPHVCWPRILLHHTLASTQGTRNTALERNFFFRIPAAILESKV